MRKRLLTSLLAGGLMASMLPGVASADWPGSRGDDGPMFAGFISCDLVGGGSLLTQSLGPKPAGVQGQLRKEFNAAVKDSGRKCVKESLIVFFYKV